MRKLLASALTATVGLSTALHADAKCDAREFSGRWTSVAHVNGADFNESLYCDVVITGQANQLMVFQHPSNCARVPEGHRVNFSIHAGVVSPTCEFDGSLYLSDDHGSERLIMAGAKGERATDTNELLTIVIFGYYAKSKSVNHPNDRPTFTMTFYRSR